MSCGVGHRLGLDPVLLWLWCRPAATALIGPLAWEPPYALGAALEKTKKKKKINFHFLMIPCKMPGKLSSTHKILSKYVLKERVLGAVLSILYCLSHLIS